MEVLKIYTEDDLFTQLKEMKIDPQGTIMVHSSMKSIGEVENGADTVLDAFSKFMKEGLLVFPTHTWDYINTENPKFYVADSPSHVGILTELFRKRAKVIRSHHPTHSVAALGKDAYEFTKGDEKFDTPAARQSPYGKLLDQKAKIVLVGVDLKQNTFIHGIEEWLDIPDRMGDTHQELVTVFSDDSEVSSPQKRHIPGISLHYWKVEKLLAEKGAIDYAQLGDAEVLLCDTVLLNKYITEMLQIDPALFSDDEPLSDEFIQKFREVVLD